MPTTEGARNLGWVDARRHARLRGGRVDAMGVPTRLIL